MEQEQKLTADQIIKFLEERNFKELKEELDLPLLAKKLGLDPAIMAAPLITTILDTCTILVYFNIVTAFFHL